MRESYNLMMGVCELLKNEFTMKIKIRLLNNYLITIDLIL